MTTSVRSRSESEGSSSSSASATIAAEAGRNPETARAFANAPKTGSGISDSSLALANPALDKAERDVDNSNKSPTEKKRLKDLIKDTRAGINKPDASEDMANLMMQVLADSLKAAGLDGGIRQNSNMRGKSSAPRDNFSTPARSSGGGRSGGSGGSSGSYGSANGGVSGSAQGSVTQNVPSTGGSPTAPKSPEAMARAKKAFEFFKSKGLTDAQAAGIVGNLLHESGGTMDGGQNQIGGGPGRGIAQWSVGERWNGVIQTANEMGKPPEDLDVQLEHIWKELNSSEGNAMASLRAAGTMEQASVAFRKDFERAGVAADDARIGYAKWLLGGLNAPPTDIRA